MYYLFASPYKRKFLKEIRVAVLRLPLEEGALLFLFCLSVLFELFFAIGMY